MPYGTIKIDTVTFTDAGVDKSVTLSGLVQNPTFSGNVTVTGTLSGVTVTGTTANFTSGNFTNISGGTHTITSGVFAAGSAASPSITFTGDLNTGIYSPGADQVAISTGGTGRLFVDASGNVEVVSNSNSIKTPFAVTNSGTSGATLGVAQSFKAFTGSVVDSVGGILGTGSTWAYGTYLANSINLSGGKSGGVGIRSGNSPIVFFTGNSDVDSSIERLRITSAGLVGVGTSSPGYLIHLNTASAIDVESAVQNSAGLSRYGTRGSGNAFAGSFTAGKAFELWSAGSQAITIDSSQRVGVGTTSPGASLHVAGTIASAPTGSGLLAGINGNYGQAKLYGTTGGILDFGASGADANARLLVNNSDNALQFYTNNSGSLSERLRIDSSGRVGIGTSSPNLALHVSSGTAAGINNVAILKGGGSSSGNGAGLVLSPDSANTYNTWLGSRVATAFGGASWGCDLVLSTNNNSAADNLTERMRITSAGNVGIGTTSAQARLHVVGDSNNGITSASTIRAYSADSTAYLSLQYDGVDATITSNPSAARFAVATNGTERCRVDSSGRLLVGTSSARSNFFNTVAGTQFQVEGTTYQSSSLSLVATGNNSYDAGTLVLAKGRGNAVGSNTIVQNGTPPDILGYVSFQGNDGSEFVEGASIKAEVDGGVGANDLPSRLVFSTTADGASSPTERMRIRNNGEILFGGITSVATFNQGVGFGDLSATTSYMRIGHNTTGAAYTYIAFGFNTGDIGSIVQNSAGTAVAYNTSSDYRLKENVVAVTDGITRLQQLKPSRFNFIADPAKTVDGFIAHEVQTIVPEAITGEKDAVDDDGNPIYQGIDQSKLVPLLTAALQEAIAKIESLEARVAALEA